MPQPRQLSTRETNVARRAIRAFWSCRRRPETSCDELLLHSGLVPGGARPEDMDLPHRAAFYACAGLELLKGSNASLADLEMTGKNTWLTRTLMQSVSSNSGGARKIASAMAERALPLAKARLDHRRREQREQYDFFARSYVEWLESFGINSSAVVAGHPEFERYAKIFGRPNEPWWYNFSEAEPVKPRASERVILPWPPRRVISHVRRRLDEDTMTVEEISDGFATVGDDSSDWGPNFLIVPANKTFVSAQRGIDYEKLQKLQRDRNMHTTVTAPQWHSSVRGWHDDTAAAVQITS